MKVWVSDVFASLKKKGIVSEFFFWGFHQCRNRTLTLWVHVPILYTLFLKNQTISVWWKTFWLKIQKYPRASAPVAMEKKPVELWYIHNVQTRQTDPGSGGEGFIRWEFGALWLFVIEVHPGSRSWFLSLSFNDRRRLKALTSLARARLLPPLPITRC